MRHQGHQLRKLGVETKFSQLLISEGSGRTVYYQLWYQRRVHEFNDANARRVCVSNTQESGLTGADNVALLCYNPHFSTLHAIIYY